jgi:hypothetical protein
MLFLAKEGFLVSFVVFPFVHKIYLAKKGLKLAQYKLNLRISVKVFF